jgi:hypothetical protein
MEIRSITFALFCFVCVSVGALTTNGSERLDFDPDIRPILSGVADELLCAVFWYAESSSKSFSESRVDTIQYAVFKGVFESLLFQKRKW